MILVIYESGWIDGSGWSYKNSAIERQEIDVPIDNDFDWFPNWIKENIPPCSEGEDIQLFVSYYAGTEEEENNKAFATSKPYWVSEIKGGNVQ